MLSKELRPVPDVLSRVKRGLAGYLSYLAACEMNEAFSEYVLYEPTLRILTSRGFIARCECVCPGYEAGTVGDKKRIDFVVVAPTNANDCFALEMKWAKSRTVNVSNDVEKLRRYRSANPGHSAFICVFGRKSFLEELQLRPSGVDERGRALYADLGRTKYGCRTFQVI